MSLLPSFAVDDIEDVEDTAVYDLPEEYGIDFKTGQLTGKKVTGKEAVKVWIWLCLHCQRFRYPIYSWEYGVDIESYIGETVDQEFLDTDLKKEIQDAIYVNPYISDMQDWNATKERSKVHITFTAITDFGEVEIDEFV